MRHSADADSDSLRGPRPCLELPDPALVVLVGAAGSGKSTFATRHFPAEAILSSDELRRRLSGDAADQAVTGQAFAALHRAVSARLAKGLLTVVDATNVTTSARRPLLQQAATAGVPACAIVLDLPEALVRARNEARPARSVPADVVERQLAALRTTVRRRALETEGFVRVVRLIDPGQVDGLRIRTVRARSHPSRP